MWLGTDKSCYVTDYDISDYSGDCTSSFPLPIPLN
jgi:hypothetical protein